MKKCSVIAVIVILALSIIMPTHALALSEPDTVSLDGIEIFQDLLTTGDFLAVVPYEVSFGTAPDDTIDETFIFRLMSPDGSTENGTAIANPAYDGGYGHGVVSFYFASGMTADLAYIFRVQQNPEYYPSAQYWDLVVSEANYSSESDQAAALKAKIIDSAIFLTTPFEVSLLTTSESGQTVLSSYGELYYLQAIPGLQNMTPSLFSVQLESPDYTKRTWSYTVAEALETKYADTPLYDFMTGFAGLFSLETSSAANFLAIIIFTVIVGLSLIKFKATMLSAFVDGYAALLLMMLLGMFSMIWAGFMAFVSTVLGGVILFLNKA